jgi:outer membrane protein insertion porin family
MGKLERIVVTLLLITSRPAPQLQAQTVRQHASSVSAYKLKEIKVTGTKRYTPDQIIAFSGLRLGENISEENFKDIVQRLGETGMFTNVAYSFSFLPAGTKVEFQLADNDKLVPVEFDNFVWFSDQALIEKMQKYVPLFRGEMPLSGNLPDKVTDALQFVLAERGLDKARVDVSRPGDEERGTIDRVIYSISGVEIHIRNMEFPGAGTAELPLLTRTAQRAQGSDYERSKLRMFARLDLTPIYLQEGKLRAKFGEPQAKIVHETPDEVEVDAVLPVEEGYEYKLAQIEWSGNTVFPTTHLSKGIHQQPGQTVNAVQLNDDLDTIKPLYQSRGYMKAVVTPHLHLNDAEGTASYKLEVKEGDQYRMGDVEIEGLDEKTSAHIREAWTLHQGEPYDAGYKKRFLKDTGGLVPPSIMWGVTIHEDLNERDKTVDVTVRFKPRAAN